MVENFLIKTSEFKYNRKQHLNKITANMIIYEPNREGFSGCPKHNIT